MLKVGDKLPDFSCLDDKGNNVTQDDFKGKKVVLFLIIKFSISEQIIFS